MNSSNQVLEPLSALPCDDEPGQCIDEDRRRAEHFRALAFTDPVVGLPNRAGLMAHLDALAAEMTADAALALLQIDGLGAYSAAHGYAQGDQMIAALAGMIRDEGNRGSADSFCARLYGGCFALRFSARDEVAARVFGDRLRARLNESIELLGLAEQPGFAIGIGSCRPGATAPELLAAADTALAAARHLGVGTVVIDWQNALPEVASQAWQRRLERGLADQRFFLAGQPVFSLAAADRNLPSAMVHTELLARLRLEDGGQLAAGQFVPMAARHGLLESIDRACLEQFFVWLSGEAPAGRYSFNLSADALRRGAFTRWLCDRLHQLEARASSLILEVSVFAAQAAAGELAALMSEARRHGVELVIDQYGLNGQGFDVLRSAAPDYVKLAGSLLQGLVEGDAKHFYLESVCGIACSLDMTLIATCVESVEQLAMLRRLGVDAAQGNALAPVRPLFGAPALN